MVSLVSGSYKKISKFQESTLQTSVALFLCQKIPYNIQIGIPGVLTAALEA